MKRMDRLLNPARRVYAWFLWDLLEHTPRARDWLLMALGKRHPIFLDYPVKDQPRYGYGKPPHRKLFEIIERGRSAYVEHVDYFMSLRDQLVRIPNRMEEPTIVPAWLNSALPALDAISIYGFISKYRPKTYLEIGSGQSTKFARQAIADSRFTTRIVSIDPEPRAEIDSICDKIIRAPLEDVDLSVFDTLERGDILFVDNSHRCFMNSDVTVVFLDVLPRLKSGVLVGFHDIALPLDYEPAMANRHYSEQYLLAVHLLAEGPHTEILFAGAFVSMDRPLHGTLTPVLENPCMSGVSPYGSAFWLRIC